VERDLTLTRAADCSPEPQVKGDEMVGEDDRTEWLASTILQAAAQAGVEVAVTSAGLNAEGMAPDRVSVSLELDRLESGDGSSALTDSASRHEALESLRRSEERFRSVVESIEEAVFMTEGTQITYSNRAFSTLLGVTPSPAAPVDGSDLLHRDDVPRFARQIAELSPEGPASHAEYKMRAANGREITLETSAIGVGVDGKPTVLWLGQDVTQRRLLEGQLLQADRLSALGTLAAGMAHAINNPLSYTLLNLEHVSRRMRALATGHDYYSEARVRLAEAHDGADRVAKVVRQMRTLSRARNSGPGAVDVRIVLDNVLAMIGNEIRYRGQLVTRFEHVPRVWAREGELDQAFLGLLLHVARSRPEETSQAREISLFVGQDPGGGALVRVSDDGPPMDTEMRARLLDPFASGETMGLGLAMCNAIFTGLGGRMDVESGPLSGTTFSVFLPAARADASPDSQKHPSVPPSPHPGPLETRLRVLVIDDDPGVASTLRAMLEAHHEVTSVESAREGLRLLLGNERFDIAFCDLVMPEVSGIDVYCALELNRPEATKHIVFMTGGVFTPEAERFLARIPNLRIEKPFSLARVEQLLAQAVRTRDKTP
jgi:two-component system cell cycle sensor histidine kinase/response regulator CckA